MSALPPRRRYVLTTSRFLLACLHVDSLLDKRTIKDVKISLAKLTKGAATLNVAYAEALQRIEGQLKGDRKLAKRALSWITFAKRPFTTTEICCALALQCDVCTLSISRAAFRFHCNLCAGGDWDICEVCREWGATCMETDHVLVKRTMVDGF